MPLFSFSPFALPRAFRRARPRRGFSFAGLFFLIGMIAIAIMIYMLSNHNEREAAKKLEFDLTDPKSALERFFIARATRYEFKSKDWQVLLEYQSLDDQTWLDKNLVLIAGLNPRMPGVAAHLASVPEQQYAALEVLLRFGFTPDRPFVSTVEQHGDYAIAYYQMPNNLASLTPAFLHNDGGQWRIMRFLGGRDDMRVISALADAKESGNQPLDADEELYHKQPNDYAALKLNQMYALVGMPPPSSLSKTPQPAPAPNAPASTPSATPVLNLTAIGGH